MKRTGLPVVCANLFDKRTGKPIVAPWTIKKVGNAKVGVFGLITTAMVVVIVAIVAPFLRDHKAIDAETTEVLMDRHLLRVRWRSC